jgi:hypothetical protein
MDGDSEQATALKAQLTAEFLDRYGELIGGPELQRSLGFRTAEAFRQARRRGQLSVPTFQLPSRRGHFALARDVAEWLCAQRFSAR